MELKQKVLAAETGMLIRRPIAEVFDAFIDPAITTKFWFTHSTGKLAPGKEITWSWEMYNVRTSITVKEIAPNNKIVINWENGGSTTRVVWTFEKFGEHSTFVNIVNDGFTGDAETIQARVKDSVGGFCWVLAGCKAYLEHNIQLNLIADRFPAGKH
ncbi:MAG: SRPBCC family protein [Bacteroidota bacterium]